ncbi:MAG: hypothetical protein CMJ59_16080 [Planctomycetaceae bacterium]|nr:hypothetical protein [Planctomycetaceae bacterium]
MRAVLTFVATLAVANVALAQTDSDSFEYAATNSYSALEQRVSALEQQKNTGESSKRGGATVGAEVVFLRPFGTDNGMRGHDYQAAPRVWLGWQGERDLGMRVRWFEYHQSNLGSPDVVDVEAMHFDLELTSEFNLGGHWNALLSGGTRYAEVTHADEDDDEETMGKQGTGPVLGFELSRDVTSNVGLFVLGRTSIQFGNGSDTGDDESHDYETFAVTEIQIGTEWNRPILGTALTFVRAGVESQFYHHVADADDESLGLFGANLSFGIQR